MRVGVERGARPRGCRPCSAARRRACRPARGSGLLVDSSASAIWSPTVKTGLSEVIGSWKIIEMRLPRTGACRPRRAEQVGAVEAGSRRRRSGRARATRRMIESAVTLLPQPDSPTRPSVSPRRDREVDAVDRPHHAVAGEEVGLQPLDLEHRASVARAAGAVAAIGQSVHPSRELARIIPKRGLPHHQPPLGGRSRSRRSAGRRPQPGQLGARRRPRGRGRASGRRGSSASRASSTWPSRLGAAGALEGRGRVGEEAVEGRAAQARVVVAAPGRERGSGSRPWRSARPGRPAGRARRGGRRAPGRSRAGRAGRPARPPGAASTVSATPTRGQRRADPLGQPPPGRIVGREQAKLEAPGASRPARRRGRAPSRPPRAARPRGPGRAGSAATGSAGGAAADGA